MIRRLLVLVSGLLLLGCSSGSQPTRGTLSMEEELAIADTIRGIIREYSAAWTQITCENQDAVLRFFDWSGPGLVDANETTVTEYAGDAWPNLVRDAACSRVREEAGIDSLLVRVLSRDIVTVSWTFHAAYIQKVGPPKLARGAVLQAFRRTADGWKTPVGMSTHQPVPPP